MYINDTLLQKKDVLRQHIVSHTKILTAKDTVVSCTTSSTASGKVDCVSFCTLHLCTFVLYICVNCP